jgi:hypothetical protein
MGGDPWWKDYIVPLPLLHTGWVVRELTVVIGTTPSTNELGCERVWAPGRFLDPYECHNDCDCASCMVIVCY